MKIFYDTEFIEDGRTIELISIGMVAEDGRELYLVAEDIESTPLFERIGHNKWLMVNVIPHLPLRRLGVGAVQAERQSPGRFYLDMLDNRVASRRFIRNAVREFVQATPDVELWAWYGAYDHVLLSQLFGTMEQLPNGFPMWTNDVRQEVARLGIDSATLPAQDGQEHNALADAHHVRAMYLAVRTGEASGGQ